MIRHVVMAKFREDLTDAERDAVVADLRSLPGKIDLIRSLEVGLDVLQSPRSWNLCLVSGFDSLDTLAQYAKHPDHVPVAQRLVAASSQVASVDYEV